MLRAALVGLVLALPALARAADAPQKTDRPAVVVRIAALDDLRADLQYLAELVGQGEKTKQLDGIIQSRLEGIDAKKPLGAYGWVGRMGIDSQVVVLIPVADQKAFLGVLEGFNITPDKGADGVYTVNLDQLPAPAYFRFANGYAYITVRDKELLDKGKLLAPEKVLPAGQVGTLSLAVNIDQIPDNLKELALGNLDNHLANEKDKDVPNETEAEKKLRLAAIDHLGAALKSVLTNGGETALRLELNRKTGDLSLSLSMAGKAGSPLAATIKDLGRAKSITASLIGPDSALNSTLNLSVPQKMRAMLGPVIEQQEKKALEKETDKSKREALGSLLKAIDPTLKSGELDVSADLRGPFESGLYTLVAGIKVQDGAGIDKALRQIVGQLPPKQRKIVTFDVEKVGPIAIHSVAQDKNDKKVQQMFGENPLYVAVRDNELIVALGEKGLSTLKEALATAPKAAPLLQMQMSALRMAPLLVQDNKEAPEIARKVFNADKGDDKLHLTMEGGELLKLRLGMKGQVVTFFEKLGRAKKGQAK
jgi:hypothetical protein